MLYFPAFKTIRERILDENSRVVPNHECGILPAGCGSARGFPPGPECNARREKDSESDKVRERMLEKFFQDVSEVLSRSKCLA